MKEKLSACFDRLQTLDIKPTKKNMEALLQTLYDLQEIYNELEEAEHAEHAGREDGSQADPG